MTYMFLYIQIYNCLFSWWKEIPNAYILIWAQHLTLFNLMYMCWMNEWVSEQMKLPNDVQSCNPFCSWSLLWPVFNWSLSWLKLVWWWIRAYLPVASLMAQMVKNLPAMQETQVWSLGQEDHLEKGIATTPTFLPGEFHGQRSLVGYSPWGWKESDATNPFTLSQWLRW